MAITLPLPVRVAAGLLATGIDVVRSLPADIPAIPVTLVGNALKLSIKVQQEIATLATRGDELLGGVVGAPQENPSWAQFDDDPPPAPRAASTPRPTVVVTEPTFDPDPDPAPADESTLTTPEASAMPPVTTTAMEAALEVPDAVVEFAMVAADDPEQDAEAETADEVLAEAELVEEIADDLVGRNPAAAALADEIAEELVEEVIAEEIAEDVEAGGPAALPGYDGMSLSEVRGHLRELAAGDVSALLEYEQNGDNRAPFLTLLSNRLVTLDAQLP